MCVASFSGKGGRYGTREIQTTKKHLQGGNKGGSYDKQNKLRACYSGWDDQVEMANEVLSEK